MGYQIILNILLNQQRFNRYWFPLSGLIFVRYFYALNLQQFAVIFLC